MAHPPPLKLQHGKLFRSEKLDTVPLRLCSSHSRSSRISVFQEHRTDFLSPFPKPVQPVRSAIQDLPKILPEAEEWSHIPILLKTGKPVPYNESPTAAEFEPPSTTLSQSSPDQKALFDEQQ